MRALLHFSLAAARTRYDSWPEVLLQAANAATGMPAIVNFTERKMLKRIFEIWDQAINTTTNPVQNPLKTVVLSQAKPNGLLWPHQGRSRPDAYRRRGQGVGRLLLLRQAAPPDTGSLQAEGQDPLVVGGAANLHRIHAAEHRPGRSSLNQPVPGDCGRRSNRQ